MFGVSSGACREKTPLRGAQAVRNGSWREIRLEDAARAAQGKRLWPARSRVKSE